MKTVFEPSGCILFSCPQCEQWLDADAEECECGWSSMDEDYHFHRYDDDPEEEPYDVPEP